MSDNSDGSIIKKWKDGWLVLWRFFYIFLGFGLVVILSKLVLAHPVFYTPLGGAVRWVIWLAVLFIGFPFLSYWAGRWYDTKR